MNQCKSNLQLSIIIVSYNTKDVTDNCLASIYSAKWNGNFEVIVVDNNSQDGSVEMIREKYPDVNLIANSDNKFFAIANNQGAKIAKGKYILLLNSDTLVYDNNLQRMIDYFDTLPQDVICIGPKILNKDKSLQSCGAPALGYAEHFICQMGLHKRMPFLQKIWTTLPTSPDITHNTGWVSGCCMMMPRDKYLEVGGLNEKLIFYGEEPEFGFRTIRLGYKTLYYSDAEIIHLGGLSTKKTSDSQKAFEKDMQTYESLVRLTNGYQGAINVTRLTILACRIKVLLGYEKEMFRRKIEHEKKVVKYLKMRKRETGLK